MLDLIEKITSSKFVLIALITVCNVAPQILYKKAMAARSDHAEIVHVFYRLFSLPVIFGVSIQVIGLVLWLLVLKRYELIWAGLVTAAIPLILSIVGIAVFGERLTLKLMVGGIFIIIGMVLINK
jgi:drug/metabolite transporter (DMT)-like permease